MFNFKNPYDLGFWAGTIATFVVGVGGMFMFSGWFILVSAAWLAWMLLLGGTSFFAKGSVDWEFSQFDATSTFTTPATETANEAPSTTDAPATPTEV